MTVGEINFWNDSIFGIVFEGREANPKAPVRYISANTEIVIFVLPGTNGGGAEKLLKEKGFNVSKICEVENDAEALKSALAEFENSSVAIVLNSDKYWKENHELFKNYSGVVQLFSVMKLFYNFIKPSLKEVYNLLDDDLSREIFTEVLNVRFKIKSRKAIIPYFDNNQYFTLPEMNLFEGDSVFVDCGAFVGDTLERFINNCQSVFGKYYAFEPGTIQGTAFSERKKRLVKEWALAESKIQLIQAGVGNQNTEGIYVQGWLDENLIGRRISYEKNISETDFIDTIKIVRLDDVLEGQRVDFIKSDVEGSEMQMLQGAENIIKTQKPLLALSIYHKLTDYYEIPLYIKNLVPEYHMKIRHHSTNFPETVLYCYI